MHTPPPVPWAKLKRDIAADGNAPFTLWRSLIDHSADVDAIFEALLDVPSIRSRAARLASLDVIGVGLRDRLCVLAALHDFGKSNRGFQARWNPASPLIGHVREAWAGLRDPWSQQRLVDPTTRRLPGAVGRLPRTRGDERRTNDPASIAAIAPATRCAPPRCNLRWDSRLITETTPVFTSILQTLDKPRAFLLQNEVSADR
jgi:HD domain